MVKNAQYKRMVLAYVFFSTNRVGRDNVEVKLAIKASSF